MVFFAPIALLALILPVCLASPLGHRNVGHRDHIAVAHRRACKATSSSAPIPTAVLVVSSSAEPTSTLVVSSTKPASSSSTKPASSSTGVKTYTESADPSSSKTSTSASVSPTGNSNKNLLAIFPVSISNAISSWSTSSLFSSPAPLSDATLNIFSGKTTPHKYVAAPDGSPSMEAFYAAGSISPGHTSTSGGFALYSKGLTDLSKGNEVTFGYSVFFPSGFQFNKGGKMPGLYGGINDEVATKCSGGDHNPDCWSTRLMWRTDAAGELYAYLPQVTANTDAFSNTAPKTVSNDAYGTSVGRGAFKWATGEWTHVAQRVKLNDVGQNNGEVEVYANGVSVMSVSGLQFRTSAESLVRGAQIQTFFGGHTSDWASPVDQSAYFKDFSAAVIG